MISTIAGAVIMVRHFWVSWYRNMMEIKSPHETMEYKPNRKDAVAYANRRGIVFNLYHWF